MHRLGRSEPRDSDAPRGFEPKAAEAVFVDWLEEQGVPVLDAKLGRRPARGVFQDGQPITQAGRACRTSRTTHRSPVAWQTGPSSG